MTSRVVIDASVGIAAVTGAASSAWALDVIAGAATLAAPALFFAEGANALRRLAVSDAALADAAYADLVQLPVETVDFAGCADRVWELRHRVSAYDAWYIAAAESLGWPLATLDRRLAGAGTGTRFLLPAEEPRTIPDDSAPPMTASYWVSPTSHRTRSP